jgi:hypothetical protein
MVKIDDFGERVPCDQDTLLSSANRISGSRHGGLRLNSGRVSFLGSAARHIDKHEAFSQRPCGGL